jgi:sigma-B regulation protein RsbU (phosphoserine phosphatase)
MATVPEPENSRDRRTIASLTGEVIAVYEELALLHSLVARLGRLMDADLIASTALREAADLIQADFGWVVLWDPAADRVPVLCSVSWEAVEQVNKSVLAPARDRGIARILCDDLASEWQLPDGLVPGRFLACEMRGGDLSQGFLCLGRRDGRRIFTAHDQKLTHAIASVAGLMLDNVRLQRSEVEKQRMTHELELAQRIQRALLPREFNVCAFLEGSGVCLPCHEIGGDYFDLIPIENGKCLLAIADVSGKGPAAALQAAVVQGILHSSCRYDVKFERLLVTVNQCLRERSGDASFVTAFLAMLDRSGRLIYSNAGHNPPLLIRACGEVTELTDGGPILGMFGEYPYREAAVQMQAGDLLLMFTDGVTDLENSQGESFDTQRLKEWAATQAGRTAVELQQNLMRTTAEFSGNTHQTDDLTVLAVRFID